MRRLAAVSLAAVLLASCGGATVEAGDDLTAFQRWCAEQTPDRCVDGFFYLYWEPDQEQCVVEAASDLPLDIQCSIEPGLSDPPDTTIPSVETLAEDERLAAEYQAEAERRWAQLLSDRPQWEPELASLLQTTHPDDSATMTLVPSTPLPLAEADALVAGVEGRFEQAWRSDYVCVPGEGTLEPRRSRVAYRDGVERAARQRRDAEEGRVTVTGWLIVQNAWAWMEQEARALEAPGVRIEALTATVPTSSIPAALAEPSLRLAWIGTPDEALLGLSDPPQPDCPR